MGAEKGKGGSIVLLLVLVGLLVGVGHWNYQRNVAKEDRAQRPFRGYSDPDLATLVTAYSDEIKQYSKKWDAARGQRVKATDVGLVGDGSRQFQAVQKVAARTRGLKRDLAERQASLVQIRAEQALRDSQRDRLALFLRRVSSFD